MRKDIKELSNRVEILEQNKIQEMGGEQKRGEGKNMMNRIKIEKKTEKEREREREREKERERRRRNVIIKRMEVKEEKRKETVKEILEKIEIKVEVKEIRKIGEGTERGRGEIN